VLHIAGQEAGTLRRTAKGLDLQLKDPGFADWIDAEAQAIVEELHARWKARAED
jgi:ParB family chromosome partitioning protein